MKRNSVAHPHYPKPTSQKPQRGPQPHGFHGVPGSTPTKARTPQPESANVVWTVIASLSALPREIYSSIDAKTNGSLESVRGVVSGPLQYAYDCSATAAQSALHEVASQVARVLAMVTGPANPAKAEEPSQDKTFG